MLGELFMKKNGVLSLFQTLGVMHVTARTLSLSQFDSKFLRVINDATLR